MRVERPVSTRWIGSHFRVVGWFAGLAIAIACGLAYARTLSAPFVFDDESSILTNSSIRSLWPLGPVMHPPEQGTTVSGRPLLNFSFALNYWTGGVRPKGYHVANLVIHALAGMVLFGILRRTLRIRSAAVAPDGQASRPAGDFFLSFACALIWTIHPLQSGAVTYVAQRAESLMGLFYLLTLYCFIRGAESGNSRFWFAMAIAACALGVGTKEVMVTAPVILLLFDRTFLSGSLRIAWRERWPVYLAFACTWIELGYLVASADGRGGTAGFGTPLKWWQYSLCQIEAVTRYLRLAIWPHPLIFDYGHYLSAGTSRTVFEGVLLLGALAATGLGVWRRTVSGFLGACFFVVLAPSSSFVPVATEIMAEHRMYIPLAAIVVAVAAGLYRALGTWTWLPGVAVVIGLGWATWSRNEVYRNGLTLWEDTVRKVPANPGARNNLGLELLRSRAVPAAIEQFTAALQLDPAYVGAMSNLGAALFQAGHFDAAVTCFEQVLQRQPNFIDGQKNLAIALAGAGRLSESIPLLQNVEKLRPDDVEIRQRLAREYQATGKKLLAIDELAVLVRTFPGDPKAQSALGDALLEVHRAEEAIPHYIAAVQLSPQIVNIQINLGSALLIAGHPVEAINVFQQALRAQPNNRSAHINLGIALRSFGRLEEAQREFSQAEALPK